MFSNNLNKISTLEERHRHGAVRHANPYRAACSAQPYAGPTRWPDLSVSGAEKYGGGRMGAHIGGKISGVQCLWAGVGT